MGIWERIKEAQERTTRRNDAIRDAVDEGIAAGDHLARGVRILRGSCPNCGESYEAEGSSTIIVTCSVCSESVRLQ